MPMSRIATVARGVGALAALLFVGGPLAIQLGAIAPLSGFYAFGLGGLLGLVAFALGVVGLLRTRRSSGRAGRDRAWVGTALGGAILAIFLGTAAGAPDVPPIHDITTDPDDAPMFTTSPADRPAAYPADNASLQREAYPDLASIHLDTPPAESVERVAAAFEELGFEVTRRDPEAGAVEGNETSRIFRFVDDVVARIRPDADGSGSVVDIRSRSRVGQSDLGANADRIRRIRDALGG